MSILNKLVDNVYVLNLERDLPKYDIVKAKLDKKNIQHERFIGVDGYDGPIGTEEKVKNLKDMLDEYEGEASLYEPLAKRAGKVLYNINTGAMRTHGAMGCLHSHRKIIQDAIDKKYKKILLLQDDIYFHNQFEEILNDLEPTIKSSAMVHLGATEYDDYVRNIKWRNPSWSRKRVRYSTTEETCGLWGAIVDQKMFEPFMRLSKFEFFPADGCFALLCFNLFFHSSWVAYPNLIIADLAFSKTSSTEEQGFKMENRSMSEACARKFGWDLDYYDSSEGRHEQHE